MGGSVTIAARFNDGQAISIHGWTNFIPAMVMNDTTLSGDDSIVKKTLLEAAAHKELGGPAPLCKSGYGIVVIDFMSREIHSIQGYTSFTNKSLNQLIDINATGWKDDQFIHVFSEEGGSLLDARRVTSEQPLDETVPYEEILYTRESAQRTLSKAHDSFMKNTGYAHQGIIIDTAPFVVHDYGEIASFAQAKKHLGERGFPLTKKDGLNAMLKEIV